MIFTYIVDDMTFPDSIFKFDHALYRVQPVGFVESIRDWIADSINPSSLWISDISRMPYGFKMDLSLDDHALTKIKFGTSDAECGDIFSDTDWIKLRKKNGEWEFTYQTLHW